MSRSWTRASLVVLASLAIPSSGFLQPGTTSACLSPRQAGVTNRQRRSSGLVVAAEGAGGAGERPVVVGYPGGVADLIAQKLKSQQASAKVRVIYEREGYEEATAPEGIDVVSTDLNAISQEDLAGATSVFVSMDMGSEKEVVDAAKYAVLPGILEKLPATVPVVVAAYANDTAPGTAGLPLKLFGGAINPKETVESVRGRGSSRNAVVVQHGRLFGYRPGQEPLPFVNGPLQTPTVEESFGKQGTMLALGTSLARGARAATLRSALAECMVRVVDKLDRIKDFSVVSLEGPRPGDNDWANLLAAIDTTAGVTVFEKALGGDDGEAATTKVDLKLLQNWLQEDFGSSLSELAISRVLNAPKPTRVSITKTGGDLVWQYVDKDLTFRETGRWCIQLDQQKDVPTLRVLRVDAAGDMLTEPLPGEQEVVRRFSELLGKLVYSKKLSKKKSSSV